MSTASEITQKLGFVTSDVAEYTRPLVPEAAGLAVYGAYTRSIAKAVKRFVGEELGKGEASSIMLTSQIGEATTEIVEEHRIRGRCVLHQAVAVRRRCRAAQRVGDPLTGTIRRNAVGSVGRRHWQLPSLSQMRATRSGSVTDTVTLPN